MNANENVERTWWLLRLTYGVVPIVVGLDKVLFSWIVDWETYLAPWIADLIPVEPVVFMGVVGVIEIIAGIGVLTRYTRVFGYVVAAWLLAIAVQLATTGQYYDIAIRDVGLAVGAVALAQLSAVPAIQERLRGGASAG